MMFTGIIEEIGRVEQIRRGRASAVIVVEAERILRDIAEGDSIAVNGVCLTVTDFTSDRFTADVMHETLDKSSLWSLTKGSRVNLERAMAAGGRFGGHIVSGHIDGTGRIRSVEKDDNAIWYTVEAPEDIMKYIVKKGSVAIDGASLTVAVTETDAFKVSVIPHTASNTVMMERKAGDIVNIENDVIGKYVEKLMAGGGAGRAHEGRLTAELLAANGFM